MTVRDDLGMRMKMYESIPQSILERKTPVSLRIDGKAFHTFTRGFDKPFDEMLMKVMQETMRYLCENIQGCVFGYTQSDEITLILIDYQNENTEPWFGYKVQKMCSVAASMATMCFNKLFSEKAYEIEESAAAVSHEKIEALWLAMENGATFDCRCFNVPKEEVCNLIYWRQLDAIRNSVQMVGQANFSHKELQNKSCNSIKEMLASEKNIDWNDYPIECQRGSCCRKIKTTHYCEKYELCNHDSWEIDLEIPIFKGDGRKYINDCILYDEK
ncbi:tRNA(His) guanylyltransferase Thg1 family protein [Anaerovoracaceae bacterium 41-7]